MLLCMSRGPGGFEEYSDTGFQVDQADPDHDDHVFLATA